MVAHAVAGTYHGYYYLLDLHMLRTAGASLLLALGLFSAFLLVPPRKNSSLDKLPWYDILLAIIAPIGSVWLFINPMLFTTYVSGDVLQRLLAAITILATLEVVRRTVGWLFVTVAALFFLHTMFCNYFPGFLGGRGFNIGRIFDHLFLSESGIYGVPLTATMYIVTVFLLFSQLLFRIGAAQFFINLALSIMGRVRGAPAKVAVISSGLFSTISGIGPANVLITGAITIPMMKKIGYDRTFAGAVEAAASNAGCITPPVMGIVAFIIPEFIEGVTYWQVAMAAAIPALLYYICVFTQVDLKAARMGLRGLRHEEEISLRKTLKEGWLFLVPIFVLIFFLGVMKYSAVTSCIYAIGSLVAVSMFRKETRLGPKKLLGAVAETGQSLVTLVPLVAACGIVLGLVMLSGVGVNLTTDLQQISGGNLIFVAMLGALASLILGMGMTPLIVYIILAVLVAPAMVTMGVQPLAAHLFVYWWGMLGAITPPVCTTAYVAATLADGNYLKTGILATRLAIVAFIVSFSFLYNPSLLMIGSVGNIVVTFILSVIGAVALSISVEGFLLNKVNWLQRILFGLGGLLQFFPSGIIHIVGLCVITVVVLSHWWQWKRFGK